MGGEGMRTVEVEISKKGGGAYGGGGPLTLGMVRTLIDLMLEALEEEE